MLAMKLNAMAGFSLDPQVVDVFLSFPIETWEAVRDHSPVNQISATLASIAADNPFRFAGSRSPGWRDEGAEDRDK